MATTNLATTEQVVSLTYGERTEIRELVDRIRAGLPNAKNVPNAGILALAQAAFAHDLDPWNGEIWVIYNEKKDDTSIMAGIKGWRKVAKRQMPERDHYYIDFKPIHKGSEDWHRYGLDMADEYNRDVERAELCILRRSDQMTRYIEHLDKLKAIAGSYDEAIKLAGPAPCYMGIGIVRVGERSKMEKGQLVQKRAEQDALKKAFDLPFAVRNVEGGVTVGVHVDDEDTVTIEPGEPEPHWSKIDGKRKFFWGEVRRHHLDKANAYALLNVGHLGDFSGTVEDAVSLLDEYEAYQQQALDEA